MLKCLHLKRLQSLRVPFLQGLPPLISVTYVFSLDIFVFKCKCSCFCSMFWINYDVWAVHSTLRSEATSLFNSIHSHSANIPKQSWHHDTSRSQARHSNSAATFRPVSLTSFGSYAKSPCGTTAAPMSFPLASAKFASTKAVMALLQWWTMPNTGSLWEPGVAQPNIEGDHFSHGKIRRFFEVTTTLGNGFRMFQVEGNAKKWVMK